MGFQFILMNIIGHLVSSQTTIDYRFLKPGVFFVQKSSLQPLDRQTLQSQSQSTATSVATTMVQHQPYPYDTMQQNQIRFGKLT
jgi:hypothetical protein